MRTNKACTKRIIYNWPGIQDIQRKSEEVLSMNMSPRQCTVLEGCLDLVRQFFHASGDGLRHSYLDRSPELLSLTSALSLYTQTTDSLIKTFVATQTSQGKSSAGHCHHHHRHRHHHHRHHHHHHHHFISLLTAVRRSHAHVAVIHTNHKIEYN